MEPMTTPFLPTKIVIDELDMDGTDLPWTVPNDTGEIDLKAVGGDINMLDAPAATPVWTLFRNAPETIPGRQFAGQVLYFNGALGSTVQFRYLRGHR